METPSAVHNAYVYTFYVHEQDLETALSIPVEEARLQRDGQGVKAMFRDEEGINIYLKKLIERDIQVLDIVKEDVDIEAIYREVYGDAA